MQQVSQSGLSLFTWRLWLQARGHTHTRAHTQDGKHSDRSITANTHAHACKHQIHSRYTADSGDEVEGQQRTNTHTRKCTALGQTKASLTSVSSHSSFACCPLPPFLPSVVKAECCERFFSFLFACRLSRPETKQQRQKEGKSGHGSVAE